MVNVQLHFALCNIQKNKMFTPRTKCTLHLNLINNNTDTMNDK